MYADMRKMRFGYLAPPTANFSVNSCQELILNDWYGHVCMYMIDLYDLLCFAVCTLDINLGCWACFISCL